LKLPKYVVSYYLGIVAVTVTLGVSQLITVGGKAYLSVDSPCLPGILAAVHGIGHEGVEKTLHRLRHDFFVLGARGAVKDHVQACVTC
jgi:hypothetical protein